MKRSGKFYRNNEAEVMNNLGLSPVIGSGAGWILKEDGENEHVMAQLKSTDASSIKVAKLDIDKLVYNAGISKKIPVFAINFLRTDEVFLLVRPEDLRSLSEYLDTGETHVKGYEGVEITTTPSKTVKRISSGNKGDYWEEVNSKYQNKKRK